MSATIKLSTKLPGDATINGLDAWAEWLKNNPNELLVCVVYLDVQKVTIDTDSGDHTPTVRTRRIEPLGPVAGVSKTVRAAVAAAEEERTGMKALPFEIVDAGEYAHGDPLPES
jgi:hypothetical protein